MFINFSISKSTHSEKVEEGMQTQTQQLQVYTPEKKSSFIEKLFKRDKYSETDHLIKHRHKSVDVIIAY